MKKNIKKTTAFLLAAITAAGMVSFGTAAADHYRVVCKTVGKRPVIILGGSCKPGQNKPGSNKPEQNKPGSNKPEQNKPGNNGSSQSSYEQQVINLVNQERAKAGLSALKLDKNVAKAALVRAKETEKSFSHTRPNGSKFTTALTENGAAFRGAGENIAWGQKTPQDVMKSWMNSPGHRANILNKKFTTIGVGYYKNASGVNYWTQLFTY